jgi:hypothetical protein
MGYHRAGFDVVGVDIKPQPRYPFEFHQADALTYPLDGFDAIHASPMWYRFSPLGAKRYADDPDTVTPVAVRLAGSGLPWVCESGTLGPLKGTAQFCGPAFGLGVIRHMYFASSALLMPPECNHVRGGCASGLYVPFKYSYHGRRPEGAGNTRFRRRLAAGIDWMNNREAYLAVPPAYAEFIGGELLKALGCAQEAVASAG